MDIKNFVNITSRAWSLPILSQLHEGIAGRQAPLLAATGAGRTAFAQSIKHLTEIGLLERNPGHGHPLRSEFRLTPLGKEAAQIANGIHKISDPEEQVILRKMWTVPVLTSLHRPNHFNGIKRDLVTISDRALSSSLRSMEEKHWVVRSVDEEARPPRSVYSTLNLGGEISKVASPFIHFSNV